jgi:hypothetical protein
MDGWMSGWTDKKSDIHNIQKMSINKAQLKKHIPRTKYITTHLITYTIAALIIP